jgi:hypothetical protein
MTLQKSEPQFGFEGGDRGRQRRLRDERPARAGTEAAGFGDRNELPDLLEVHP